MTAPTSSSGTDKTTDQFSYRLSIRYESSYGQHTDNLHIEPHNLNTVLDNLPAAIHNDLTAYDGETVITCDY